MKNRFGYFLAAFAIAFSCATSSLFAQAIDSTFNSPHVYRPAQVDFIRKTKHEKIYLGGDFSFFGDKKVGPVIKLTAAGHLDTSFQPAIASDFQLRALEVLPNGNVLIADEYYASILTPNGKFVTGIEVESGFLEVLPDNRILTANYYTGEVKLYNQNGILDNNFAPAHVEGDLYDLEVQGNKVLLAGDLFAVNGVTVNKIARLNLDGSVDTTFKTGFQPDQHISKLYVQPDGKIIPLNVAVSKYAGQLRNGSVRLNQNGSLDPSFNLYSSSIIYDAQFNNGKITIHTFQSIIRTNENGAQDKSFKPVKDQDITMKMEVMDNNAIVVGNSSNFIYGIGKYNPVGARASAYEPPVARTGIVNTMGHSVDALYIGGDFVRVNSILTNHIAKLNNFGEPDASFAVKENHGPVSQLHVFDDGKILSLAARKFFRLNSSGSSDASFSFSPFKNLQTVRKFIVQDDVKILVSGPHLYRLNYNGSEDTSFDTGTGACCIGIYDFSTFDLDRTTGKIIFGGGFDSFNGVTLPKIVRLNPNGSVDESFDVALKFEYLHQVSQVRILENGEILIQAYGAIVDGVEIFHEFVKVKLDGTIDMGFVNNFQPDNTNYLGVIHPFHERVLIPYSGYWAPGGFYPTKYDGTFDTALNLPANVESYLNNLYSAGENDLFILGATQIRSGGDLLPVVKVLYPDAATSSSLAKLERMEERSLQKVGSVYPNPARDYVAIEVSNNSTVFVSDLQGQRKMAVPVQRGHNIIDVSGLPNGQYVISVRSNGKTFRQHLLKSDQ